MKQVENAYKRGGMTQALAYVQKSVDEWKDATLNIGVTGRSGVGKSTLINTLRGLTGECQGAAENGATETTSEATAYPHPDNEKLVYWDLPGIGTLNFSKDTYFEDERIQFAKYDMFLILSCGRFFEDDKLLAETAQKMNKTFIFIRTKVDVDVESEKRAKPNIYKNPDATEALLSKIRKEVLKGLSDKTEESVFLVDCLDTKWEKYDFSKLIIKLVYGFACLKRESFILTLNVLQEKVLEQKKTVLQKQMWKVCLLAAFRAILGLQIDKDEFAVVESTIIAHASLYAKQLGISEDHISKAALMCKKDVNTFKAELNLQVPHLTNEGIREVIAKFRSNHPRVETGILWLAQVSLLGYEIYGETESLLNNILQAMASDAKRVQAYILDHTI